MPDPRAVVVTGTSTGIGEAAAALLVRRGHRVFGSVRRAADADRLRESLGERFTPLIMDVTDEAAVAAAAAEVGAALEGQRLGGLVNNAGIAVGGPLAYQPMAEIRATLETNVIGPILVTRAFLPLLGTDPARQGAPGRIVNISSVGGRLAFPFVGAYVASKHALEALTDSLRRELLPFGIDVIAIGPGEVVTAIWDKAERQSFDPYENTPYADVLRRFRDWFIAEGRKGFPPSRIAETVATALTTEKPKARYAVVPKPVTMWYLPLAMPKRWADAVIKRQLKMG